MRENPQSVNSAAGASTSDGAPRSNMMSRHEFLKRILLSGEITRVAQHLAMAIVVLADECQLKASVRDLERMTGWSKSKIADHLGELDVFMSVTLGVGRGKSIFEVQGMIEDALNKAIVKGSREPVASAARTQKTNSVPTKDATLDATADTKTYVRMADAIADMSVLRTLNQPVASAARTQSQPGQAAKTAPSNTTRATNESPTEIVITNPSPNGEGEAHAPAPHMNGVGFVISAERKAVVPAETVNRWRNRFPNIADLEAAMERLSCNLLGNYGHPGWSCPEGWMAGVLSDMNQEAKDKKRIAEAKIASTQRNQPTKTFRR